MAWNDGGKGGGGKFPDRVNAQYSSMPATECIGAGRLEGWFVTPAWRADAKGWGHIQSFCFQGDLFFHLQRSPWLRGVNFQKDDEVTFEVIEVKGRCEAVKLLLPHQVKEMEDRELGDGTDPSKPSPGDMVGEHITGFTKSHHLLVAKQKWGFVASDSFTGQVFWHTTENPDMQGVDFDRDDVVEFDLFLDNRGQVRAKSMRFLLRNEKTIQPPEDYQDNKRRKKEVWLKNWSTTPPPDWVCKLCGWQNFGRNKTCNFNNKNNQNCPGVRPPREEWPDVQNVRASEISEEDELAHKALKRQMQARQVVGREEEVPTGWHSEGLSQVCEDAAGPASGWPDEKKTQRSHVPVPVLGADPALLEAGLPGALAAQQLKDRQVAEELGEEAPHRRSGQYSQPRQYQPHHQYPPPNHQQHYQQQQYPPPQYPPHYQQQYPPHYPPQHQAYPQHQQHQQYHQYQPPPAPPPPQREQREQRPQPTTLTNAAAATTAEGNIQAVLALCLGAFNDLTHSHDPIDALVAKVGALVAEVNSVLGDDRGAKHTYAMQLAKHPWISEHGFEVRYQPGKNAVAVSHATDASEGGGTKRKEWS